MMKSFFIFGCLIVILLAINFLAGSTVFKKDLSVDLGQSDIQDISSNSEGLEISDQPLTSEDLRFSNTQEWDKTFYTSKELPLLLLGEEVLEIEMDKPPSNLSSTTKQELAALHKKIRQRTTAKQLEIEDEFVLGTTVYGTQTYTDLLNGKPQSKKLLFLAVQEFGVLVVVQKEKFDRVRPTILDTTLTSSIDIPGHPAYPSGHASQSQLIALILGSLDPTNSHMYQKSAERIAHNREIAGVHYRSDSTAGQQLARRYYGELTKNATYKELFTKAREEWK